MRGGDARPKGPGDGRKVHSSHGPQMGKRELDWELPVRSLMLWWRPELGREFQTHLGRPKTENAANRFVLRLGAQEREGAQGLYSPPSSPPCSSRSHSDPGQGERREQFYGKKDKVLQNPAGGREQRERLWLLGWFVSSWVGSQSHSWSRPDLSQ